MRKQIACHYCGGRAEYETITSGFYVCDDAECHLQYVQDQCLCESLTEEDHEEYGEEIDE